MAAHYLGGGGLSRWRVTKFARVPLLTHRRTFSKAGKLLYNLKPRTQARADLRDFGRALLLGCLGYLLTDPVAAAHIVVQGWASNSTPAAAARALANEGAVLNIIRSYNDAVARKTSRAVQRQILSPLVSRGPGSRGYTRAQLKHEHGVNLSAREFYAVRLHTRSYGASATAEPDDKRPQGLSTDRLKEVVQYLYREDNMQQVQHNTQCVDSV